MNLYVELLLVAVVVVYVVDLSGWTQTWLGWLSKFTTRRGYPPVKSLRPFSCSLCSVWWCCLLWCLVRKNFTLPSVAASAGLSFFSMTISQVLIFIRDAASELVARLTRWITKD